VTIDLDHLQDHHKAPASMESITQLMQGSGLPLPPDYLAFLKFSNGWDGLLGVEPGWCVIWPADEVLESHEALDLATEIPGFWAFGSNGAGELLAFNTQVAHPWPVVMIPYISLDPKEALPVASSFAELVSQMGIDMDADVSMPSLPPE
jgi:hypothetical protein